MRLRITTTALDEIDDDEHRHDLLELAAEQSGREVSVGWSS